MGCVVAALPNVFLALEAYLELGHSDLDEDPNAKYREKAIYVTTSVLSNMQRYVIFRTCDWVFSRRSLVRGDLFF